jgi:hypothetical protein
VSLANFEVHYVYYHVGSAIQEDEVSSDQDVGAFWRGWSQAAFEFLGADRLEVCRGARVALLSGSMGVDLG